MGYRLNRLDEPIFTAVSKPLLTEFGIYHRLESCAEFSCVGDLCSVKLFEKTNYKLQHTLDEASLRLAGHWLFINVVQPNGVYEYTLNQILLLFAP